MYKLFTVAILALSSIFAQSQQFQNVVVIVQENRTPDNLFSGCSIPGADVIQPSGGVMKFSDAYQPVHTHAAYLTDAAGTWVTKQKRYVDLAEVQPYCDLAVQYGFANRMYQTNQGPSFPAHQFIFAGTSAPSAPGDLYSDYFAAENGPLGCTSSGSLNGAVLISPTGQENVDVNGCFEHATLTDLLEVQGLSWHYYGIPGAMWNAPQAIAHICGAVKSKCKGAEWVNDIPNPPQVLTDIANGTLANVSWVTPAASYSDHAGDGSGGPAWVSSIVNAIGSSPYWENTAIIVVWDDWGGWYDHVAPLANTTGWCEAYCYGFRVPMLVISAYTPAMVDNNTHDFGSVLHFVESNFNLTLIGNGTYADSFADNLSEFFTGPTAPQKFKHVTALAVENLDDKGDPDSD